MSTVRIFVYPRGNVEQRRIAIAFDPETSLSELVKSIVSTTKLSNNNRRRYRPLLQLDNGDLIKISSITQIQNNDTIVLEEHHGRCSDSSSGSCLFEIIDEKEQGLFQLPAWITACTSQCASRRSIKPNNDMDALVQQLNDNASVYDILNRERPGGGVAAASTKTGGGRRFHKNNNTTPLRAARTRPRWSPDEASYTRQRNNNALMDDSTLSVSTVSFEVKDIHNASTAAAAASVVMHNKTSMETKKLRFFPCTWRLLEDQIVLEDKEITVHHHHPPIGNMKFFQSLGKTCGAAAVVVTQPRAQFRFLSDDACVCVCIFVRSCETQ